MIHREILVTFDGATSEPCRLELPEELSQVPSSQRIRRLEGRGPPLARERARARPVLAMLGSGGAGRESLEGAYDGAWDGAREGAREGA